MGEQQSEVDRAYQTLPLEVNDLVNADVVDDVGNQEGAGDKEGGEHEFFVEFTLAGTDGDVATGEENGTGTVESGVEGGLGEHE